MKKVLSFILAFLLIGSIGLTSFCYGVDESDLETIEPEEKIEETIVEEEIAVIRDEPAMVAAFESRTEEQLVYVYIQVDRDWPYYVANHHGWETVGTVSVNLPKTTYLTAGSNTNYNEYNDVDYLSAVVAAINDPNQGISVYNGNKNVVDKIRFEDITWHTLKLENGASDYVSGVKAWHLDGRLEVKEAQLTVNYLYADGTTAAPSWKSPVVFKGEYVDGVESPVIPYYIPDIENVEGRVLNQSEVITVTYRFNGYDVVWLDWDESVLHQNVVLANEEPDWTGVINPTRESYTEPETNTKHEFTFKGWVYSGLENGKAIGNVCYKAYYEEKITTTIDNFIEVEIPGEAPTIRVDYSKTIDSETNVITISVTVVKETEDGDVILWTKSDSFDPLIQTEEIFTMTDIEIRYEKTEPLENGDFTVTMTAWDTKNDVAVATRTETVHPVEKIKTEYETITEYKDFLYSYDVVENEETHELEVVLIIYKESVNEPYETIYKVVEPLTISIPRDYDISYDVDVNPVSGLTTITTTVTDLETEEEVLQKVKMIEPQIKEVEVEKEVIREVEKEVLVPVEVEVIKEVITEVPVEIIKYVEVPVEVIKEVIQEVITEVEVEVPVAGRAITNTDEEGNINLTVEVYKEETEEVVYSITQVVVPNEIEVPVEIEVIKEIPVEILTEIVKEVEVPVEIETNARTEITAEGDTRVIVDVVNKETREVIYTSTRIVEPVEVEKEIVVEANVRNWVEELTDGTRIVFTQLTDPNTGEILATYRETVAPTVITEIEEEETPSAEKPESDLGSLEMIEEDEVPLSSGEIIEKDCNVHFIIIIIVLTFLFLDQTNKKRIKEEQEK